MKNGSPNHFPTITRPELTRVGTEAGCDFRTVVRYLRGLPIQATRIRPIESALTACGYARLVKSASSGRRDSNPPPPPAAAG